MEMTESTSSDKWINKWISKYYSATERNKLSTYVITQLNPKYIILSKRIQTPKTTYYMIPSMWNLEKSKTKWYKADQELPESRGWESKDAPQQSSIRNHLGVMEMFYTMIVLLYGYIFLKNSQIVHLKLVFYCKYMPLKLT